MSSRGVPPALRTAVAVLLLAAGLFSCSPATRIITRTDAEDVLDRAIGLASARRLDDLCGMGGSVLMCQDAFRELGGTEAIPKDRPTITGTFLIPATSNSSGGRVLVLEGTDGKGRRYRTEFLVFPAGGGPAPQNPIYWSGRGASGKNGKTATSPSPS